jgi:hypothetical protein
MRSGDHVTKPDSVRRHDRAQCVADNKTVVFVAVKTTLDAFCKRGGRFLLGRVLPWEEVLADMNKGVLEAYLLANVHVIRLIEAGKDISPYVLAELHYHEEETPASLRETGTGRATRGRWVRGRK